MSEYTDSHMTDENGVRWVKLELASKMLNEESRSLGCYVSVPREVYARIVDAGQKIQVYGQASIDDVNSDVARVGKRSLHKLLDAVYELKET